MLGDSIILKKYGKSVLNLFWKDIGRKQHYVQKAQQTSSHYPLS